MKILTYKYPISLNLLHGFEMKMPRNSVVLSVRCHTPNQLTFIVSAEDNEETETRFYKATLSGDLVDMWYLDTIFSPTWGVFHIFEVDHEN